MHPDTVHAVCESLLVPGFAPSVCLAADCNDLFQKQHEGWWDRERWQDEQQSDPDLQQVLQVMNGSRKSVRSSVAKTFLRQRRKLSLNDGILQRSCSLDNENIDQIVVPKALQQEVLRQTHDRRGHLGMERCIELIRSRFYFPGMDSIARAYIAACERCVRRKAPAERADMGNLLSSGPMDLLCLDFLSLEGSKGGITNILVMTDHFTRYSQAIATKDQTARTTARALVSTFVNHYGMPCRLLSDQGANFESRTIQQLCELLGIKKSHTSPYHPQGNAQVERFNKTLLSMLACLTEEEKTRWKDHLPYIVHAYNCTRNDATGIPRII